MTGPYEGTWGMKSSIFWLCLVLVALPATGWSLDFDSKTVSRSWLNPSTYLTTSLRLDLPSDGSSYTPPLNLNVNLRISPSADLRLGEVEKFKIEARMRRSEKANYHRVEVTFQPDTYYHRYWRDTQTFNVYAKSGKAMEWVNFYVQHTGRIKTGAPATFEKVTVDFTNPSEPFGMTWKDFGFEENGAAATTYKFAIFRATWTSTKLVAKGEVARQDGETQSVTIEQNGPYTQGADEWFKVGQKYWVFLLLKREGTEWYTDNYGAAFDGAFTYKEKEPRLVQPAKTGSIQIFKKRSHFDELYQD